MRLQQPRGVSRTGAQVLGLRPLTPGPWRRGAWPFVRDFGRYQLRLMRRRGEPCQARIFEFPRGRDQAEGAKAHCIAQTAEIDSETEDRAKQAATAWATKWFWERGLG